MYAGNLRSIVYKFKRCVADEFGPYLARKCPKIDVIRELFKECPALVEPREIPSDPYANAFGVTNVRPCSVTNRKQCCQWYGDACDVRICRGLTVAASEGTSAGYLNISLHFEKGG